MPQIDCTASLLKDGAVPAKDVGRSAEHPKLSHGFSADWSIALAGNREDLQGF